MTTTENNFGKSRALFTWKDCHDDALLREVLLLEPYQFKAGSKDRGAVWNTIAENLNKLDMKVTQRSVRERFEKLLKEFKKKEAVEARASGIEVDFTERDMVMTDILERISAAEDEMVNKKEKEKKEMAVAEDMRMKATERMAETRKRKSNESEGSSEVVTTEKKEDVVEM